MGAAVYLAFSWFFTTGQNLWSMALPDWQISCPLIFELDKTMERNVKPRWWAQAISIGAVMAAALVVGCGLGTRFGIWEYTGGLPLQRYVLLPPQLCLGIVGYVVCLFKGFKVERSNLLIGVLVSALILGQPVCRWRLWRPYRLSQYFNGYVGSNGIRCLAAAGGEGANPLPTMLRFWPSYSNRLTVG